ncbi:MAG: hypothetical protein IJ587_00680 [Synergistaceae bacterium]|nr:hypothetical protein [Synergistaceae bacterium]
MKQELFKRLKQVIERDRMNDKERLTAVKDAQDLMIRMETFCASPGGLLFGVSAKM